MSIHHKYIKYAGFAGLAGAILVGCAEFLIQFNAHGGYSWDNYDYFMAVSPARLTLGYYLGVFAAPLYIVGYWYLERLLEPGGRRASAAFFLLGAYAFAVGAIWLGERAFLAFTVQAIGEHAAAPDLLNQMSMLNEPLAIALRVMMMLVSVIWILQVAKGRTALPRWMALVNPAFLLAAIFGLYAAAPSIGVYVMPIAMNVTHAIIFGLALATQKPSP